MARNFWINIKKQGENCHHCDWGFMGIFIYITLSGAAKGLDNGFERQFENIAMNSMFIWAERTSIPYAGFKTGRNIQLTLSDMDYIKKTIPEVQFIAPRNSRGVFWGGPPLVVRKNISSNYNIYGDFPDYTRIATKKIFNGGRFINEEDIKYKRKVCVIGERTKTELFEKDEEPCLPDVLPEKPVFLVSVS